MKRTIEAGDDYIDSRELIKRMEELQSERESLADALKELQDEAANIDDDGKDEHDEAIANAEQELEDWDSDNGDELKALESANEQGDGYGDWQSGENMIHENKWEEYAQELADDLGLYDSRKAMPWPLNCIDWEQAAEELKADYHEIDFDGHTYYIRA